MHRTLAEVVQVSVAAEDRVLDNGGGCGARREDCEGKGQRGRHLRKQRQGGRRGRTHRQQQCRASPRLYLRSLQMSVESEFRHADPCRLHVHAEPDKQPMSGSAAAQCWRSITPWRRHGSCRCRDGSTLWLSPVPDSGRRGRSSAIACCRGQHAQRNRHRTRRLRQRCNLGCLREGKGSAQYCARGRGNAKTGRSMPERRAARASGLEPLGGALASDEPGTGGGGGGKEVGSAATPMKLPATNGKVKHSYSRRHNERGTEELNHATAQGRPSGRSLRATVAGWLRVNATVAVKGGGSGGSRQLGRGLASTFAAWNAGTTRVSVQAAPAEMFDLVSTSQDLWAGCA